MTTVRLTAAATARPALGRGARCLAIGLVALLAAACGGGSASPAASSAAAATASAAATPAAAASSTATVTASPTLAATASQTAAPASPSGTAASPSGATSSDPGLTPDPSAWAGFAFPPDAVYAYYQSAGYTCATPTASTQAKGYEVTRCTLADDGKGHTIMAAIVTDPNGVPGDAFAGVIDAAGKTMPTAADAAGDLGGFLGAMLGETAGNEAGAWMIKHLGEASTQTHVGDMLVATYTTDASSSTGPGIWVEVANQAFLDTPAP